MPIRSLQDGAESFHVTVLRPDRPSRVVLFGVGRGGNPERHLPLLEALAGRGCVVAAPHFERLPSAVPTEADLRLVRAECGWLERALAPRVPVETRVIEGAGHFSFMNVPPPHTNEPLPERDAFLANLATEIGRFVTG